MKRTATVVLLAAASALSIGAIALTAITSHRPPEKPPDAPRLSAPAPPTADGATVALVWDWPDIDRTEIPAEAVVEDSGAVFPSRPHTDSAADAAAADAHSADAAAPAHAHAADASAGSGVQPTIWNPTMSPTEGVYQTRTAVDYGATRVAQERAVAATLAALASTPAIVAPGSGVAPTLPSVVIMPVVPAPSGGGYVCNMPWGTFPGPCPGP